MVTSLVGIDEMCGVLQQDWLVDHKPLILNHIVKLELVNQSLVAACLDSEMSYSFTWVSMQPLRKENWVGIHTVGIHLIVFCSKWLAV